MAKSLTEKRIRLWNDDPHCHWCGEETLLILGPAAHGDHRNPLMATVDHLRPRHHPDRLKRPEPGERLQVLACWRCNNNRDKAELAAKPKEWFETHGSGAIPLRRRDTLDLQNIAVVLSRIRPRGKKDRESVKNSIIAVGWELWERGMLDDDDADGDVEMVA